ncbi:CBS domain-containing protein [Roseiconus lacunae]|uniref:CBS domain-containing protein n=1 Tax=Roseiconus lacunae TaxID=2605694 RepID=A0ABT7PPT3_9BACT|nr:CBS domain-containing protein [Roseiconus lacunae]MCD0462974.1 CBS domain-containing protein [Roseiconus lacunae]MDM4018497.1 CBS domain-containing protein [Roseiconus lacunae]WRQ49083.1 CBS domain-containing protein [Stieleria sp. HD01]
MGFLDELNSEPVKNLPLRDAIVVNRHTIARAAIALMRSHDLGCSVIVEREWEPSGIFTEQSVIRLLHERASLDSTPVSKYCDSAFRCVKRSAPIREVWDAVADEGVRFVCVTDEDGQLIGLAGQRSLADYLCDCYGRQVAVQRLGSKPWMLQREGA